MDRHPGWSIVEGNAACMMYLYRNWSFSRRVEENVAQLSALANDITENYDDCDDKFLTAEAAAETIKVAERVYDFYVNSICSFSYSMQNTAQKIHFVVA